MRETYSAGQLLLKAIRAGIGLATARIALRTITPDQVLHRNIAIRKQVAHLSRTPDEADILRLCNEAGFFISRLAARVPWRSDCLVQALAGQQWLAREGIASEIVVGTAKHADGSFLSHAWLRHDSRIVLGGDISLYSPLLTPDSR
jgi:Transglutaminase-like superfamily